MKKQNKTSVCIYLMIFAFSCCLSCKQGDKPSNDRKELATDMVLIEATTVQLGAMPSDTLALAHEKPSVTAFIDSFYMDVHEVTNAQFKAFVDATGYQTVAERDIDWEEMKQHVPPGTLKPPDSLLVPGSLVFTPPNNASSQHQQGWWQFVPGANWKHPSGPNSSIEGKENEPVVHMAYEDAKAYANWAGKRLPTEAEWTAAARGGREQAIHPWGNEHISKGSPKANYWTGHFPHQNTKQDGFEGIAPVKSYPPNNYGLYDMAGNVWEITADKFHANYLKTVTDKVVENPKGASEYYNPSNPYEPARVMKGGSYLCNESYCASYRVSARMAFPETSGTNHIGFRCVQDIP